MKKNPVMNYNSFMSAFKSAVGGYSKKANIANKDAGAKKINQGLSNNPISGASTASISKYTKEHLARVKKSKVVGNGKKK
jgi:hypothetical protein